MSKYKCLIFDIDNTILNYDACAASSLKALLEKYDIQYTNEIENLFRDICYKLWKAFDLNMLNDESIRKNYHQLFDLYNYKRFEVFCEHMKYSSLNDTDPKFLSDEYIDIFNTTRIYENCAVEILKKTSKTHILAAATNGLSDSQRKRIQPVEQYLSHLFISEEMNCVKPMKEFYDYMLHKMNLNNTDCLFIGDLYTTDIVGALNANMDACWYRANGRNSENWLEASTNYDENIPVIDSLDKILDYI